MFVDLVMTFSLPYLSPIWLLVQIPVVFLQTGRKFLYVFTVDPTVSEAHIIICQYQGLGIPMSCSPIVSYH